MLYETAVLQQSGCADVGCCSSDKMIHQSKALAHTGARDAKLVPVGLAVGAKSLRRHPHVPAGQASVNQDKAAFDALIIISSIATYAP